MLRGTEGRNNSDDCKSNEESEHFERAQITVDGDDFGDLMAVVQGDVCRVIDPPSVGTVINLDSRQLQDKNGNGKINTVTEKRI